ncbi:MAG: DUF1573 domain-containing protein [Acidobacteria bacterium]|nr:DUF1573 domain-containing protein [Acidobacteriota bacterium]
MTQSHILAIVFSTCISHAQSLQVEFPRHDFGRITNTAKATHGFKITNAGDKDLLIANVRPSCGCTSTVLGKSTLAPGESTTIETTFTAGNAGGRVEKTIQVESNDPKAPTTTLILAAEVIRDLYTDPPGATFFDVARRGTRELSLRLKSDTVPAKVETLDVATVPYLSSGVRTEGDTTVLDLRFDPTKLPPGQLQGNGAFLIKTSQPANGTLTVPVMWSLARTFVIVPDRIGMRLTAGQEQRATVRVSRADGQSFRILGASSEALSAKIPALGIRLPETREGKALDLTVLVPASLAPGMHRENLVLKTDDPDEPTLSVPVNLLVAPEGKTQTKGEK